MPALKYIWIGELDRFGYTLTTVGTTEEEVRDALIKNYISEYKAVNGTDPDEDIDDYTGSSYLDGAKNDISTDRLECGKVEWR